MDEQKQGIPKDPSGIPEPHDVLAAEEFAMPAGTEGVHPAAASRNWTPYVLAAVAALFLLLRRRRR
jgi:MYXO-CTERM domain-containing protein